MIKLIIALVSGILVYLFREFNKSEQKNIIEFMKVKENYTAIALNFITGMIILFSYQDNPGSLEIIGVTKLTFLTAAIIGFTGNTLWSAIIEGTSRRVKTKLGLNQKR
ncbi:MAG: hypothetical protein ACLFT6_07700 [Bacteroidales bacterium]